MLKKLRETDNNTEITEVVYGSHRVNEFMCKSVRVG